MMKIIIFVLVFNGVLIMMCKSEIINLDNMCKIDITEYSRDLICENLNLTNDRQHTKFISDEYNMDKLYTLICKNCIIPSITNKTRNIFTNFGKIYLNNCSVENIDQNAFHIFDWLREISFENNHIKELKSFTFNLIKFGIFGNYKVQLYLPNNKIENIQEYCFNSEYIFWINLESNQLTEIKNKVFVNATSLEELNLSNNLIEIIEDDSFLDQGELLFLHLSHNKLTEIKKNTFNGLKSLFVLNLSYNNIKFIDSSAFQSMKDLLQLSLDHNNLKKIEDKTFCNLRNLMELRLNHNEIENIGKDSFLNSDMLEELLLNNNKLKSFNDTDIGYKPNNILGILHTVSLLDLSMNSLESVYFGYSYKLQLLNLSSNNIKDLNNDTFKGIKLDTLILSNNKIEKFDAHVLYPKTNLRTLYIDGNQI